MTVPEPGEKKLVDQGLDVVCSAEKFGRSESLANLLRYLVEKTLNGKGAKLRRKDIAEEYFGWSLERLTDKQEANVGTRLAALRKELLLYKYERSQGDPIVFELAPRGYAVRWTFIPSVGANAPIGTPLTLSSVSDVFRDTLLRSGFVNAFRIKAQNEDRLRRVTELIRQECKRKRPYFRLVASSGNSYLPPSGIVWARTGLGKAVLERNTQFEVVLESPFSDFAECRALANGTTEHHWQEKVNLSELQKLASTRPGVSITVTDIPVNCSLFFTSTSVLYDPYLWGRPDAVQRTENNFWVFEFLKSSRLEYDCYGILAKHFQFVQLNSVNFREFVGRGQTFDKRTEAFGRRMEQRFELARKSRIKPRRALA